LRADNQRLADRAQKLEAAVSVAPAPAARAASNVERAALAAIAAAVEAPSAPAQPATYGDVTVRPVAQKPTLFPDKEPARAEAHGPAAGENLHPAGRGTSAAPRPAHAEIRGPADAGPGRDSQSPGRGGGTPAKEPAVAVAAAGQCRPRP